MDQRIQNTHTALQSSMRALLGKTTWDKITIKVLCENAGISRTTFYANFTHKDDLLDALLKNFEIAMKSDNNGRSLAVTRTFRFLPIFINHVNGNRQLFFKTNTSIEGYPVAEKFKKLIDRLTLAEIENEFGKSNISKTQCSFIAGGIYSALITWSGTTNDKTHLKFLTEVDFHIRDLLEHRIPDRN